MEVYAYFKTFGEVTAINLDERKQACTVHFKEASQAEAAATAQGPVMGDPRVEIVYNVGNSTPAVKEKVENIQTPVPVPEEQDPRRKKLEETRKLIQEKR